jgi:hypothetical protein
MNYQLELILMNLHNTMIIKKMIVKNVAKMSINLKKINFQNFNILTLMDVTKTLIKITIFAIAITKNNSINNNINIIINMAKNISNKTIICKCLKTLKLNMTFSDFIITIKIDLTIQA